MAKVQMSSFKVGQKYDDGFSWLSYLAIQSFLVDSCILRDYLSEFMAEFVFTDMVDLGNLKIKTMGMLKKNILKKITESDSFTTELRQETSKNGWVTLLGDYRDMVVHSAPLAQAERRLFSICEELKINGGGRLPIIRCPIPENPGKILSSRSSGSHFENFENQLNLYIKAADGDIPVIDGLDYASFALGKLAMLSDQIAEKSPIAPQMLVFDHTNIIGGVKITKLEG